MTLVNRLLTYNSDVKKPNEKSKKSSKTPLEKLPPLTIDDLAAYRYERFEDSFLSNKEHTLEKKQTDGCFREVTLLATVIERNGELRRDWLRDFLVDERLPRDLGWTPISPSENAAKFLSKVSEYKERQKNWKILFQV